jgi:murein endopeptidase
VGCTVSHAEYDAAAAAAMVRAFAAAPEVERVLFGDADVVQKIRAEGAEWAHKVMLAVRGHKNHIHIDIKPPSLGVV